MPPAYPKTDILLAYKELMTQENAGAVSSRGKSMEIFCPPRRADSLWCADYTSPSG